MSHAILKDHMTSRSSTFPYTTQECRGFLKLLNVTGTVSPDSSQALIKSQMADSEAESLNHTCVLGELDNIHSNVTTLISINVSANLVFNWYAKSAFVP